MTTAVLVDWLGRGGIAQTTDVWRSVAEAHQVEAFVVTRAGRELTGERVVTARSWRSSLVDHVAVVRAAVDIIRDVRPDVVVIQNYVLPFVEVAVHRAARQVGARTVFVVHDHQLHTRLAGSSSGVGRLAARADVVVAHSDYVGRALGVDDVIVLPLPPTPAALAAGKARVASTDTALRVVHFGVLVRKYKGSDVVAEVARQAPKDWSFVAVGVGAASTERVAATRRFVPVDELAASVACADVALLPYRLATQSASVVFAQATGTPPVASAVGGIPEQIADGRTGRLVEADAPAGRWLDVLSSLADPTVRGNLATFAREAAVNADVAFRHGAAELLG